MNVTHLDIPDVLILRLDRHLDERGWFQEFWNPARMSIPNLPQQFVQDNVAFSHRGVLRGLHFQIPFAQAKLVIVLQGEIFDVVVDIRPASSTFGRFVSRRLTDGEAEALYVPDGFAHGYQVLSETALVLYKCTEVYHPEAERTLAWNDRDLNIPWPIDEPLVSPKDTMASSLRETRAVVAHRPSR